MRAYNAGDVASEVPVEDASRVGQARRMAMDIARAMDFDEEDAGRVGLVATELGTNILKHAQRGVLQVQPVVSEGGRGVEMTAIDKGEGFDFAKCLADGMSTAGTPGIGLGAVGRIAQVMDMYADHRGSVVMARVYPRQGTHRDLRFGASQRNYRHEPLCGDGWSVAFDGQRCMAMLVDGLGHGAQAHDAARAAVDAFPDIGTDDPSTAMDALHRAMTGTRGGALAVASYDGATGHLRYAGIGNISAALHGLEGSRGMASHPGIVGVQYRSVRGFDFPDARGRLLILHSDGLQTRWSLSEYPGLVTRHPAVIAAVLMRDFDRGRDDATVVVLSLG